MTVFKCKMCGGDLDISQETSVCTCQYCGSQQTLPKINDAKRADLYQRANNFRRNNEYDKAAALYELILSEDRTDSEAYWSLVLCKYGVEYVEDPYTRKRIPTCNRTQFTSITLDEDYSQALAHADTYAKCVYEAEAMAIDALQKDILSLSTKEDPFDVFICYKETDNFGRRTRDSVLAQDLYRDLASEGFKVFFARITLEDRIGSAYEPYIFAALQSAKVMLVLGTNAEHFNAVCVKNEWSRYLALIKNGAKKTIIPVYSDMEAYNLPSEFSHLQAQDLSKVGCLQDLIRGIHKICDAGQKPTQATGFTSAANTVTRGMNFLEDGDTEKAREYFERALDADAHCSTAYLGNLLIKFHKKNVDGLKKTPYDISVTPEYKRALLSANSDERKLLEEIHEACLHQAGVFKLISVITQVGRKKRDLEEEEKSLKRKLSVTYGRAYDFMRIGKYEEAIRVFTQLGDYNDSHSRIHECNQLIAKKAEDKRMREKEEQLQRERETERHRIIEQQRIEQQRLAEQQRIMEEQHRREQSNQWASQGLCRHCGGTLSGLFTKKCKTCGMTA